MEVTIHIPDDVAASIQVGDQDLARRFLEAYAVESYKSGELTAHQVGQMLGFETLFEIDAFLKAHAAYIEYSDEETAMQRKALLDVLSALSK